MNTTTTTIVRVRFCDQRSTRRGVTTELAFDTSTNTWTGETGALDCHMLDDARLMMREGQMRGGVYPFDLVTFEVTR